MNSEETLAALVAEIGELRATIAQQQADIAALQSAMAQSEAGEGSASVLLADAPGILTAVSRGLSVEATRDETSHGETSPGARGHTSRRRLLQGAAVSAAAATVAAVSLGSVPEAHAATGGNFVLGGSNDANATTALANTSGSAPNPVMTVTNNDASATTGSTALTVTNNNPNTAGYNDGIDSVSYGGWGVYAVDQAGGTGVEGDGLNGGAGVVGYTDAGWGVIGVSGTGIDLAALGTGRIFQYPQSTAGIPSGSFLAGEAIRDANGDLWLCVAGGTPGTWVKVAHLAPGATSGGAITYLSKPIRLLDTRPGGSALFTPGAQYAGGSTHTIQVAGDVYNGVTVPAPAAGAIGNVTVVNPTGGGYLAIVPSGAGFSGTANLAFSAGQIVSNSFNVGLNGAGALDIIIGGNATDVILDLFAVVA